MKIPRIRVSGNAYDRGLSYGKQASELIIKNINNYHQLMQDRKNLSIEKSRMIALSYEDVILACNSDYIDEIKGIAKGANVAYADVLLLNCRSEILFNTYSDKANECTAITFLSSANSERTVYACQSWDFASSQKDNVVLLEIVQPNAIMMIVEAGMIGGKGLNTSGLGLTLNALNTDGGSSKGVPLHVRMRKILDSFSLDVAYQQAVTFPIPCACNLIISSKDGLALGIELTSKNTAVYYPNNGIIFHTNHLLNTDMNVRDLNKTSGSTFVRYASAKYMLEENKIWHLAMIKDIFKDHRGYPKSICVHADESLPTIKQLGTNHAIIMDLNKKIIYYAHGNPCQSNFIPLGFSDI
ncbi:MAG: C45 family peptidase [Erysipelotrichaceae bacterium]|nr:C45 family peptidase [Erysipelotrichaceae bacterium]